MASTDELNQAAVSENQSESLRKAKELVIPESTQETDKTKDDALHKAEIDRLSEQNKNLRADREMRQHNSKSVFRYLVFYSFAVLVILLLSGSGWKGFKLSDIVLQYLVGSTAVSAIGLVTAVVTGLFLGKRK